jgi:hypothetical protein
MAEAVKSNAANLATARQKQGFSTCLVHLPNWRINSGGEEQMEFSVREAIREMDPTFVIYFFIGNNKYYERSEDGIRTAPRKGPGGLYRVKVELTRCSRGILLEQYNAINPLWDLIGKRKGILVSPMPRHIVTGCCSGHCSNRRCQDFERQLEQSIEITKKNLKDSMMT